MAYVSQDNLDARKGSEQLLGVVVLISLMLGLVFLVWKAGKR